MTVVAARTPMQLTARYRGADGGELLTTGLVETGDFGGARSVFLRPGDWLYGSLPLRAATLLGSCVAVMLWAPRQRVGAMCHCLLPARRSGDGAEPSAPDGRYGDEAAAWIERQFADAGIGFADLEATIAGGAKATDTLAGGIGDANLRWAQRWVAERGIALVQQDVGGRVVRRIGFNLADGSVTVAHGGVLPAREA